MPLVTTTSCFIKCTMNKILTVYDLTLHDKQTCHQKEKSHKPQRTQQRGVDCTPVWHHTLFMRRSFFSHQRSLNSLLSSAASAALSYASSSTVNNTWKEKHHAVQLRCQINTNLDRHKRKAGKCLLMCRFSPPVILYSGGQDLNRITSS